MMKSRTGAQRKAYCAKSSQVTRRRRVHAAKQLIRITQRWLPSKMQKLEQSNKIPSSTTLRRSSAFRRRSMEYKKSLQSVESRRQRHTRRRPLTEAKKLELMTMHGTPKNVNDERFAKELEAEKYNDTVNGKIELVLTKSLSVSLWISFKTPATRFRSALQYFFPAYCRRLHTLFEQGSRDIVFNRNGSFSASKLMSKNTELGLRTHLAAISSLNLDAYRRMRPDSRVFQPSCNLFIARVVAYACSNETNKFILWALMSQSRYFSCLMKVSSYNAVQIRGRERRKVKEARDMFNDVSNLCGLQVKEPPVPVRVGMTCVTKFSKWENQFAIVDLILPNATGLHAVWTDCDASDLQTGDTFLTTVTNTSGGRKHIRVKWCRSIVMYDDISFPVSVLGLQLFRTKVCVMSIEGTLGFMDENRGDRSTGHFVLRPGAIELIHFIQRHYLIAVWTRRRGICLRTGLLLRFPLLFVGSGDERPSPAEIANKSGSAFEDLNDGNCVFLTSSPNIRDRSPNDIIVAPYNRKHLRDRSLSNIRQLLLDVSASTDAGMFLIHR